MSGSTYVDNLFRNFRQAGYTEEQAHEALYKNGFAFASNRLPELAETADLVYRDAKRQGYTSAEARDEVFLTGYVVGREVGRL